MKLALHRIAPFAFAFACATAATTAGAAYYAINQIDYIDPITSAVAPWTGLWGNTNTGKVIGNASFDPTGVTGAFSFVYDPSTGAFTPIAPPAGVDPSLIGAISINDSDDITGTFFDTLGGGQGFILSGGVYTYFSHALWMATSARTISNHTALHPQGLVVGFSYDYDPATGEFLDSIGWIYDPVSHTFEDIPGTASPFSIAQGLNIAGQVVGNVRNPVPPRFSGFLYTPTTSDPMLGGAIATFQINGFATKARGINDHGIIAAAVNDTPATGATHTYVATSLGYQLVDIPSAVGPACADGNMPNSFPEGLNNSGQITGLLTDNGGTCAAHGFIATPSYVPNGTTPSGAFTFTLDVVPDTSYFLDPAVATGYDYEIGKKDPRFATVRLPLGIGNNKYVLVVGNKGYALNAGQLFDFRAQGYKKGVKGFRVACIDPAAALDPVNSLAFPTEVTFVAAGQFTGTQQPLTSVKYHGVDIGTMSQADCRAKLIGAQDGGGPATD